MTKTVALADDAYEALARLKRPGQSFSQIVRELTKRGAPSIRDSCGLIPEEDQGHWERFAKKREAARARSHGRVQL